MASTWCYPQLFGLQPHASNYDRIMKGTISRNVFGGDGKCKGLIVGTQRDAGL